ncbi:MAG TPA: SDR family NAD(P)-dependent oxidoreductase, partial [Burkholderiaceae bacterium]
MRLNGKVALVTGSTSGIGRAIVRRFLAEGAQVVFNNHHDDETAASARAEFGDANALFVAADVADASAVQAMVARGIERFGRIDVLVNNAGVDVFSDPLKM